MTDVESSRDLKADVHLFIYPNDGAYTSTYAYVYGRIDLCYTDDISK